MSVLNSTSIAEENYLKVLYKNQYEKKLHSTTNLLAEQFGIKPASVTEMIKKLSKKNWVEYKAYKGAKLTEEGKKIALEILRKQRLWKHFLVTHLEFSWEEINEIADELEHIKSENLISKIDKLMSFPKEDPFGNPIPNSKLQIMPQEMEKLSDMRPRDKCHITGLLNNSSTFIQSLKPYKILPHCSVKVIDKDLQNFSINAEINNQIVNIPQEIAKQILVSKQKFIFKLF